MGFNRVWSSRVAETVDVDRARWHELIERAWGWQNGRQSGVMLRVRSPERVVHNLTVSLQRAPHFSRRLVGVIFIKKVCWFGHG